MQSNNYWIIGHVGRRPEVKYTANGKALVTFSVATTEGYGDNKTTTWHNVKAWGSMAEWCGESLDKGSKVLVSGKFNDNRYEDRSGNKKSFPELLAQFVAVAFTTEEKKEKEPRAVWGEGDAEESVTIPDDDTPF